MTQDELKQAVARAARDYVAANLPQGAILGVGTGSTSAAFIETLPPIADRFDGFVASSEATRAALERHGLRVLALPDVDTLPIYVDGADEIDARLRMIKGGGGALTREKIVASAAERFVCIADGSKRVDQLGARPVPLEIIAMARGVVTRRVKALGGDARPRAGFVTDNGNPILDVYGLSIDDPAALETALEEITGVVRCGLFAKRPADLAFIASGGRVEALR